MPWARRSPRRPLKTAWLAKRKNAGLQRLAGELGVTFELAGVVRFMQGEPAYPPVHISVASPAGAYTVGNTSFFRYILRLAEAGLPLHGDEREALEMLAAVPHAFFDEDDPVWGRGWRIVPPATLDDWPVLESTPQRVRAAFETARRILWENAAPVGVSARDIVAIEDELDEVFTILERAEKAGVPVNISYVS